MSWSMYYTGPREVVKNEIKNRVPQQYQEKIVTDLVLAELDTLPDDQYNPGWYNGVVVEASGHSSPQGEGWDKPDAVHRSSGFNVKVSPIHLTMYPTVSIPPEPTVTVQTPETPPTTGVLGFDSKPAPPAGHSHSHSHKGSPPERK